MSSAYTQSLNRLIEELGKLPGIGSKTAERLAFHILRAEKNEALSLADAITKLKSNIRRTKIREKSSATSAILKLWLTLL